MLRMIPDGVELRVRLTPRAASDRIDGPVTMADGMVHLAARVRAVPEKGKANKALEALIAQWLGVAPGKVQVTGGETARLKAVTISGDAKRLTAAIEAKLAGA